MSRSKTSLQNKLAEIEARLSSSVGPRISEAEARRRRTLALAELAELRLRTRKGELIEAAKVDDDWSRVGQMVRDSLLSLPERVSGQVAALTDPVAVRDLLKAEVIQTLAHLSQGIERAGQQQPVEQ